METKSKMYILFIASFYLFCLPSSSPCQQTIEEIIVNPATKAGEMVINEHHKHQAEETGNDANQTKCCYFPTIRNVGDRICKSNNRSLGTLFGCLAGGTVATILVATDSHGSFQIFGDPSSLPVIYKIGGILLSTGVGGNLSSYIGASIDILTGEKTIFDAIHSLKNYCCGKSEVPQEEEMSEIEDLPTQYSSAHRHYPFITSSKATQEEHERYPRDQEENLLEDNEVLKRLVSIYHDNSNKQVQINRLLKEVVELKNLVDQNKEQNR